MPERESARDAAGEGSTTKVIAAAVFTALLLGIFAVVADAAPGPLGRLLLIVASTGLAWGVAAFALGAWAPRPGPAAVAGGLVIVGAVLTYYGCIATFGLRGADPGSLAHAGWVWGAGGLIGGPTLGVLGWHAVRASGRLRSAIWGVVAGLLLSQGVYLLARSSGGLLEAEGGSLRILLLVALPLPVLLLLVGSRRRHLALGLAVMAAVSGVGAIAWWLLLRLV
ncbi:MAG: DUF6518 family protein [Actinomycetota bacterium]|nr:DUF6518 family protein [Actinomycetota bacterium]